MLAADLGVSRGVVVEAYQQLTAEGYLASRAGGYTRSRSAPPRNGRGGPGRPAPARIDLSYGRADVSSFPRAAWLRSIRGVLDDAPNELFGYLAGSGVPQLRTAIAEYLNRVRGTVADPDHIVICTGYAQGIALLVRILAERGARRLALEDPSSGDDALPAARAAGLDVVGIPVDDDGIQVDLLRDSRRGRRDPDPVAPVADRRGARPPRNRAAVLRWAAERGAIVIEDDYDAEYRYDRDADRRHAGPGPRPRRLRRVGEQDPGARPAARLVRAARAAWSAPWPRPRSSPTAARPHSSSWPSPTSWTRGEFDRHLRRMRPIYRRRRDALLAALADRLPGSSRPASRPGCTWSPGYPRTWTRPRSWPSCRAGVGMDGVAGYRIATPDPAG